MTSPVTTVALVILYEQGKVLVEDAVSNYLPSVAEPRVFESGNHQRYETREAAREITVHDVLTHMSGLTYGFQNQHAVDAIYRTHGLGDFSRSEEHTSELQSLMRISYAVFCLKKKKNKPRKYNNKQKQRH